MDDLIKKHYECTKCPKCGREFKIVHITYPTNMEGKHHDSYYSCPYCNDTTIVHLRGNEDIDSEK